MSVEPKDKNNLVYIICYWLGIGMLLPWNFVYNVDGYWKYKFRNIANDTITSDKQKFWASDLSIVSMAPNFTFLLLNALIGHKLRYGFLLRTISLHIQSCANNHLKAILETRIIQKTFQKSFKSFSIRVNQKFCKSYFIVIQGSLKSRVIQE